MTAMNKPYCFTKTFLLMLFAVLLSACTSDGSDTSQLSQPLSMRLVGGLTQFDDSTATRAAAWEWQDGAMVYLQFKNGNNTVSARAVYSKSTDDWTVSEWTGTISTSGQCEVYYFDGASSSDQTTVTLGSGIGIYGDRSSSYAYADGVVTVSATLSPLTSRVRFVKPSGTTISTVSVEGIRCYTAYNTATNTFTTSDDAVTATVNTSTGYTSYIYGTYTDATTRQLTLTNSTDGADVTFISSFGTTVFQTGKSGTLTIPTKADSKNWTVKDNSKMEIEAIDLGLPSGVKWANMNVGANRPEDYGDYFAWGETEPKSIYNWGTYKFCNGSETTMTKYCTDSSYGTVDNKTVLEATDDAATVNWGSDWRMPTIDECKELLDNTFSEWTTQIDGVNGIKFISKVNGNFIFLPAAGYRSGSNIAFEGTLGCYWSSSLHNSGSSSARRFRFDSNNIVSTSIDRYTGQSVRAVQGETITYHTTATSTPLSFKPSATSPQTIAVTSNEAWSAKSNALWCTVAPENGSNNDSVTVTVTENTSTTERQAVITIKGTVSNDQTEVTVTQEGKKQTDNAPAGAEAVDLGLPSGLKWANMNVGATTPEGYGNFYAWGETKIKANYEWDTYKYCEEINLFETAMTKYSPSVDSKTVLDASDDAAAVNWGGKWRMPTYEEMKEMIDNTSKEWTTINGVTGRKFTAPNGNSIFLPATGMNYFGQIQLRNSGGFYWSSTLYGPSSFYSTDSDAASYLSIDKTGVLMTYYERCAGLAIRPVQKP